MEPFTAEWGARGRRFPLRGLAARRDPLAPTLCLIDYIVGNHRLSE